MKILEKTFFLLLLITLNSCVSGIFEMARGYDKYVEVNVDGRKELKNKRFKEKFKPEMAENINCIDVYYNYYEDKQINYARHNYLIFYKTGHYAYFSTESKDINLDDLNKANFVGYYIVKDNKLKLETPTGNFNTAHYRVFWNFNVDNEILNRQESGVNRQFKNEFKIDKDIKLSRKSKPNW
jgi:hypothetical protein